MDSQEQKMQNIEGKSMFFANALAALWRPLWVVIFVASPILGPQDGPVEHIIFIEKPMDFYMILQKLRSHAAWRSFCSVPPGRHASVREIQKTLKSV